MGESTSNQFTEKEKDICVFFSFDMVGSTKLKTKKENWPLYISSFYYTVYKKLSDAIPQIKVWKYLGDEILLYVSIHDLGHDFHSRSLSLIKIPKMVYDIQLEVAEIIQKDPWPSELNESSLPELSASSLPELNVKSTVWIAGIQTIESRQQDQAKPSPLDKNYKNIIAPIDMEAKSETENKTENKTENGTKNGITDRYDFLGPDMDIGFRIAKFAFHHKVVLSADFAYLLYKMLKIKDLEIGYKIDNNLRIVSYEILKGVWDEQYYPIVWYNTDWDNEPYGLFYADHKKNDIAKRILFEKIDPIKKLTQVYEDLGKTAEIDDFVKECLDRLK